MTNFERRLSAAEGYLQLDMPAEAWAEIEAIEPEQLQNVNVIKLKASILIQLKRWEEAATLTESELKTNPEHGEFYWMGAYAIRRCRSLEEARILLLSGEKYLNKDGIFHFNMACYECQLGNVTKAKEYLNRAFKIDPRYRGQAMEEPDLEPLRQLLAST